MEAVSSTLLPVDLTIWTWEEEGKSEEVIPHWKQEDCTTWAQLHIAELPKHNCILYLTQLQTAWTLVVADSWRLELSTLSNLGCVKQQSSVPPQQKGLSNSGSCCDIGINKLLIMKVKSTDCQMLCVVGCRKMYLKKPDQVFWETLFFCNKQTVSTAITINEQQSVSRQESSLKKKNCNRFPFRFSPMSRLLSPTLAWWQHAALTSNPAEKSPSWQVKPIMPLKKKPWQLSDQDDTHGPNCQTASSWS